MLVVIVPPHHSVALREAMHRRVPAGLSSPLRMTLVGLMVYADSRWEAGVTAARLAGFTGGSVKSVELRLRQLRELGLVGPARVRLGARGERLVSYPITLPSVVPEVESFRSTLP